MQSGSPACLDPEVSILSGRQSNLKFNHLSPQARMPYYCFFRQKNRPRNQSPKFGVGEVGGGGASGCGSLAASLGVSVLGKIIVTVSSGSQQA